jgi:phosphohistidine phosphatase
MKLFLLRHGEAEFQAPTDALRPLSFRGRADLQHVFETNFEELSSVTKIFASPYLRTQQSAEIFQSHFSISNKQDTELLVPSASVPQLSEFLYRHCAELQSAILIAHNPLLESLIDYLVGAPAGAHHMGTSSLACIEVDVLAAECCQLDWIRHART